MSEFTIGHLIQRKHSDLLQDVNPLFIGHLNDEWTLFFMKDTGIYKRIPESIYDISNTIPVLHFDNAEDHGWSYEIVFKGKSQAKFDYNYEMEDMALYQLALDRYPEEDPVELLYTNPDFEGVRQQLLDELHNSDIYQEQINNLFKECNVEQFSLFEVSAEQIQQLKTIMTPEHEDQLEFMHDLVDQFKEILNLQQMSWINPERLEDDDLELELE
ncbi:hypothetical protein PTI45_02712 [Paenibacillus nuruki]|uniref:Uncharacterized protein n=1 Tax=Paenibacillus nuruki TaxID=1886670 RepID=A0A1E3L2L0_9BACL|nr:hypothetical protein [Paenibacillus nuruki]ODP27893.1 hypothetical protein PTI45_02712 [Paenibacillus nuruki]